RDRRPHVASRSATCGASIRLGADVKRALPTRLRWYKRVANARMHMRIRRVAITVSAAAFVASLGAAPASTPEVEWSRFRGPNGSGMVETGALPTLFGPTQNVVWKTPLPPGYSSPI